MKIKHKRMYHSKTFGILIRKSDRKVADLTPLERNVLSELFALSTKKVEKANITVQFEALGATGRPAVLTQNEYMRRMKEMAAMQPGMSFYGELPDSYNLVVNTEHPVVEKIRKDADAALEATVKPYADTIEADNAQINSIRDAAGDKALDAEQDQKVKDLEKSVAAAREAQSAAIAAYAPSAPTVGQLTDLALLEAGLLKGASLAEFIARSVELLEK